MTCRLQGLRLSILRHAGQLLRQQRLCLAGHLRSVFYIGHRPIDRYQPRLNVVEQERFLASLDIYRLVLNEHRASRLFLSADLASTSPAKSSTGTKPVLCLTGSGGPHLKSSVFPDRWLTIEACGSFEELPTHQSSLLFPAKHANAAGKQKDWELGSLTQNPKANPR